MPARRLALVLTGLLMAPGFVLSSATPVVEATADNESSGVFVPASTEADSSTISASKDGEVIRNEVAFTPVSEPAPGRYGAGQSAVPAAVLAATGEIELPESVAVIGATWEQNSADGVELQYRLKVDGRWGQWESSDPADAEAADDEVDPLVSKQSPEQVAVRDGSDAIPVAGADAVSARLVGPTSLPDDARLSIIEPTAAPGDAALVEESMTGTVSFASVTPKAAAARQTLQQPTATVKKLRPPLRTRSVWRADEQNTSNSRAMTSVAGIAIHHTAGTNNYTQSQVPAILRGIHSFHTIDRGWSDIGYNYLIDKWGGVWEGRRGSDKGTPQGAHTSGYNNQLVGVSVLGNYEKVEPSKEMLERVARVVAWKSKQFDVNPTGRVTVAGKRQDAVVGHRDVGSTSCPGKFMYAKLPDIRQRAKVMMG